MQRTVMTGQVSTFCPVHGTLVNKHVVSYHWRIKKSPSGGGGYVGLGGGGGGHQRFFTEGHTDLRREAIGPGSNCFSMGVCTSISK